MFDRKVAQALTKRQIFDSRDPYLTCTSTIALVPESPTKAPTVAYPSPREYPGDQNVSRHGVAYQRRGTAFGNDE